MCKVETHEMSLEFLKCWKAAGIHIDNQVQCGIRSWLKAAPSGCVSEVRNFPLKAGRLFTIYGPQGE